MSFKLYYSAMSSGAANFITASLCGLKFDSEQVDIRSKKLESGRAFEEVNPKGNAPAVKLPDGTLLNENIATLTYIADQNPSAGLAPPADSSPLRYCYLNALAFVASELHPSFQQLFNPMVDGDDRKAAEKKMMRSVQRFKDFILRDQKFVVDGQGPTAADIYAYIVLMWPDLINLDLSHIKGIPEYIARVAEIPGVADAHRHMNEVAGISDWKQFVSELFSSTRSNKTIPSSVRLRS